MSSNFYQIAAKYFFLKKISAVLPRQKLSDRQAVFFVLCNLLLQLTGYVPLAHL